MDRILTISETIQNEVASSFEELGEANLDADGSEELLCRCNGYLEFISDASGWSPSVLENIRVSLQHLLNRSLGKGLEDELTNVMAFAVGRGFSYLAYELKGPPPNTTQWEQICSRMGKMKNIPGFLQALLQYLNQLVDVSEDTLENRNIEVLYESIVECLQSPSHDLRLAALEILMIIQARQKTNVSELASIATSIERLPFDAESLRSASMYTRKLASGYHSVSDPWLQRAIPAYCLGLLHVKLTPLWEDICNALKEMSTLPVGQETIAQIVFAWIQKTNSRTDQDYKESTPRNREPAKHALSDFEDAESMRLISMFDHAVETSETTQDQMKDSFLKCVRPLPLRTDQCRMQALRVLNKIPEIAEKRSRSLVPILLEWASGAKIEDAEVESHRADITQVNWVRKDQKAMLEVFAKFVNPKVLYKSNEAYQALLALLCNGDVEIQRSALKAILSWRQPSIKRYEENLTNLLDDARFRDELATFLNASQEDNGLQENSLNNLMPVLLRLLFGRITSRTGSSSGSGQQAKRRAVFVALVRLGSKVLAQFLDIVYESISHLDFAPGAQFHDDLLNQELLSQRRQVGLLNMTEDLLKELGSGINPFASQVLDAVLYCTVRASRNLSRSQASAQDEAALGDSNAFPRTIRQTGIRCLNSLFEYCPDVRWEVYVPIIVRELVNPRLENFPVESAQSPSGLLRMFSVWSAKLRYAMFLVSYNGQLVPKICEILGVPSAKDEVKLFIIQDILTNLIILVGANSSISPSDDTQRHSVREMVLRPHTNIILARLAAILRGSPSKDLLDAAVQAVSKLGPSVSGSSDSQILVEISVFLLQQPSKRVRPHTKSGILEILNQFVPHALLEQQTGLFQSTYDTVATLFGFFEDRAGQKPTRTLLCQVFDKLANIDDELEGVARLCSALNAMSTTRLGEPDFERRSQAFNDITELYWKKLSVKQWTPLVYNLLFFIKDGDELTIRTNASYALRRFVESAAAVSEAGQPIEEFEPLISAVLLSGVFKGIRDAPELVRIEYLSVLASIIREFPQWALVSDMRNLLMSKDEEASFFTNILHIQQHRRLRALRRLAAEATSGILQSKNISQFFIPLLEHFIFDQAENESAHNLTTETIGTVNVLVTQLEWPQFRAILQRYLTYLHNKPDEMQKTVIRLLGVVADALQAMTRKASVSAIQNFILGTILEPLNKHLHHKDETVVSLRTPVAVTVVKLLTYLPQEELSSRLTPVLMDISHILRSRDQASRDMTRKTLAEITNIIGPSYFAFILKELRSALLRGYQLHVLSFTIHSILIEAIPSFKPGDLDYCVSDVVAVIMDDIFGATGQEKDAEEYVSRMKEVKSSKSFDSMEIIARITTINHLSWLIRPIQALLLERLSEKMVRKIDELLRRIGLGVSHNEAVQDRDVLVFCFELIQEAYKVESNPEDKQQLGDYKTKRYLINMKGSTKSGAGASTSPYGYKLTRFSLDLLRSVLQKHEELKTPANLSGFLPIIGDALVGTQEEIQISAIRLLVAIIKVPLPQLDSNATLYANEAVRIIKASSSTNSEISQAALKLVSSILRERKDGHVKETDLAYLLEALLPDLHEPDRQGVTFNFLRAILSRKIVINEVYKVMDEVAAIMVTHQSKSIRDTARGAYTQFLMDYPQGKKRLAKQLNLLCQNLDYQYVDGRQSVMEMMHLLLSKSGDELVQEILAAFFPHLVLRLHNEEDRDCQQMLEILVKKIFERADATRLKKFLRQLRSYLEQDQQPILQKIALQVWILYLEENGGLAKDVRYIRDRIESVIRNAPPQADNVSPSTVLPTALVSALKLCKLSSDSMFSDEVEVMWGSIIALGFASDVGIQLPAAQLLGLLFNDFARHNADSGLQQLPLTGSGGIQLDGEGLQQLTVANLRIMQSSALDSDTLMNQTVRNLAFLGRCLGANGMLWQSRQLTDAEAIEENDGEKGMTALDKEDSPKKTSAISYLLNRLSRIIRRNENLAVSKSPKLPALILLGMLVNHLESGVVTRNLSSTLAALNHLSESSITQSLHSTEADKLTESAREIADKVKDKVGMSTFVKNMEEVRGMMRGKREERRKKRTLDKVTEEGMKRLVQSKKRKMEARKEREKELRTTKGVIYKGKRRRLYE